MELKEQMLLIAAEIEAIRCKMTFQVDVDNTKHGEIPYHEWWQAVGMAQMLESLIRVVAHKI